MPPAGPSSSHGPGGRLGPGARLGPYAVVRLLGQGGTSAVLEARDPSGRSVAVKVLLPQALADPELVERARRESSALARLSHPGIVPILGVGEDGGAPWIALELLGGGTLADEVRRRGPLPRGEALAHAAALSRALAHVHAAGLVHRDVKPENVFLDGEGQPRLGDFGFALDAAGASASLTRTGEMLGTPHFLAPEQVDRAHRVDARADLYGLGATLHVLLAGAPPFAGLQGTPLLYAKLREAPPDVRTLAPAVPEAVAALVARLLAVDPAARGAGAAELARELDALARGGAPVAAKTRPRAPLALAVLAGTGALGLGLAFLGRGTAAGGPGASPLAASPTPALARRSSPGPARPSPGSSARPATPATPAPTEAERARARDLANEGLEALHRADLATASFKADSSLRKAETPEGHHLAGVLAMREEKYEAAAGHFDAEVRLAPANVRGWHDLASSLLHWRDEGGPARDRALEASRTETELAPDSPDAWQLLADVHLQRNEPDLAVAAVQSALAALDRTRPSASHAPLAIYLARANRAAGRLDDAWQALAAAVTSDPTNRRALEMEAELFLEDNRYQDALDALKRAAPETKVSIGSAVLQARALAGVGRRDEALGFLDRAETVLRPREAWAMLQIASARKAAGDVPGALRLLDQLAELERSGMKGAWVERADALRAELRPH